MPLLQGTLLRRYKRFLCDARLTGGEEVTAHCPNPGSMLSLLETGTEVWLSRSTNPNRKLKFSWELVRARGALVSLNTGRANAVVGEALNAGKFDALMDYDKLRPEVRYGTKSRIDFLLEADDRPPCYLEVKSVTMCRQDGLAEFPDSVTTRGTKHLRELATVAQEGKRAVLFFLVQRGDCQRVGVAGDIDPDYMTAFGEALTQGVEVLSYCCRVTPEGTEIEGPVALDLA